MFFYTPNPATGSFEQHCDKEDPKAIHFYGRLGSAYPIVPVGTFQSGPEAHGKFYSIGINGQCMRNLKAHQLQT